MTSSLLRRLASWAGNSVFRHVSGLTGGSTFRPIQWCVGPQFDADDLVTTATIPAGETWCIASADTRGNADGDPVTTYQVFGRDDPKFGRR